MMVIPGTGGASSSNGPPGPPPILPPARPPGPPPLVVEDVLAADFLPGGGAMSAPPTSNAAGIGLLKMLGHRPPAVDVDRGSQESDEEGGSGASRDMQKNGEPTPDGGIRAGGGPPPLHKAQAPAGCSSSVPLGRVTLDLVPNGSGGGGSSKPSNWSGGASSKDSAKSKEAKNRSNSVPRSTDPVTAEFSRRISNVMRVGKTGDDWCKRPVKVLRVVLTRGNRPVVAQEVGSMTLVLRTSSRGNRPVRSESWRRTGGWEVWGV